MKLNRSTQTILLTHFPYGASDRTHFGPTCLCIIALCFCVHSKPNKHLSRSGPWIVRPSLCEYPKHLANKMHCERDTRSKLLFQLNELETLRDGGNIFTRVNRDSTWHGQWSLVIVLCIYAMTAGHFISTILFLVVEFIQRRTGDGAHIKNGQKDSSEVVVDSMLFRCHRLKPIVFAAIHSHS